MRSRWMMSVPALVFVTVAYGSNVDANTPTIDGLSDSRTNAVPLSSDTQDSDAALA